MAQLPGSLPFTDGLDPTSVVPEPVPPVVDSPSDLNGFSGQNGVSSEKKNEAGPREIALGRNMHTSRFDTTGPKKAYTEAVLERDLTLVELSKHRLETIEKKTMEDYEKLIARLLQSQDRIIELLKEKIEMRENGLDVCTVFSKASESLRPVVTEYLKNDPEDEYMLGMDNTLKDVLDAVGADYPF